ncbi:hypothetical protein VPH234P10_0049 [Vibrio phage 234P10]|nr:hypothetical protein SIPHO062v1_p0086 [Vibrio phage PS17B.1]
MISITNTVLTELRRGRTVVEITELHDLTSRQVRNAIKQLDQTYHIDRVPVGNAVVYKIRSEKK